MNEWLGKRYVRISKYVKHIWKLMFKPRHFHSYSPESNRPFDYTCLTHFSHPSVDKRINVVKLENRFWVWQKSENFGAALCVDHPTNHLEFIAPIFNTQRRHEKVLCIFSWKGHPQLFPLTSRVYLNWTCSTTIVFLFKLCLEKIDLKTPVRALKLLVANNLNITNWSLQKLEL